MGRFLRDPSECFLRLPKPLCRRETEAWASGPLLRLRNWATVAVGPLQDSASDTRL